jgi:hypothetical protein
MENNNNWNIDLHILNQYKLNHKVLDLSVAIEKYFHYPDDKLTITIDTLLLDLPLRCCFSDLLDDFLLIIKDISETNKGSGLYGFSQNTSFDADWKIEWYDDSLFIDFIWRSIEGEILINQFPQNIKISKSKFLNSWENIFRFLFNIIDSSNIEDKEEYHFIKKAFKIEDDKTR